MVRSGLGVASTARAGNGGSIPPEDYLIPSPADPMPEAELNSWHRGEPMHRVEYPETE
jgi:hypothetical protein